VAHMHYKGTGQMHSFRGQMPDDTQRKIRIQGPVGAVAWRITKFLIVTENPGVNSSEVITKVYREEQDAITSTIDLREDELLACVFYGIGSSGWYNASTIIMDNALFVRDIYITTKAQAGTDNVNYYIELEEVKVSAAGMAQLALAAARRT